MKFTVNGKPLEVDLRHLIVAGWTGRDREGVDHHIRELAEIGVAPPSTVPLFYRVAAGLLTTGERIQAVGGTSSGEVEPLILQIGRKRYLGLASDQTDRQLEAHSVALSKQICAKPCAPGLWPWEEVADRLDALELASWVDEDGAGEWVPYQQGTLEAMRPLADLIAESGLMELAADGPVAMVCGTLPVLQGGIRPAARFRMMLRDNVRGRAIRHEYAIEDLPEIR